MTTEKMSPLRRRMIEDMEVRGLGAKTQAGHIHAIKDFAAFLGRSPDTATPEDRHRPTSGSSSVSASRGKARKFVFLLVKKVSTLRTVGAASACHGNIEIW